MINYIWSISPPMLNVLSFWSIRKS